MRQAITVITLMKRLLSRVALGKRCNSKSENCPDPIIMQAAQQFFHCHACVSIVSYLSNLVFFNMILKLPLQRGLEAIDTAIPQILTVASSGNLAKEALGAPPAEVVK